MNRLFIVEGLPCSGKSTISKFLAEQLKSMGKNVVWFDEGTLSHPADYEFHAFVTVDEYQQFDKELQVKVRAESEAVPQGYIVPLSVFGDTDLDTLIQYKIYDSLPWEIEASVMLDKWRKFVQMALCDDFVYVFNCVFLQNPMCETMMRFGFDEDISFAYISQIYEIVKPLEPRLVYLGGSCISDKIRKAAEEREGWLDAVIDYHVKGNFGKSIGAEGFDGYINCLIERQKREQRILDMLPVHKLILTDADKNWKEAEELIKGELL